MAVDFVSPISLDVSSTSLAADGYSFDNLLNKKPFRAEYFVKPPVAIVFKAKVDIDIYCVSLQLDVGQHKVRGVQLDVQSSNSPESIFITRAFTDKTCLLFKNNGFHCNRRWTQIGLKVPPLTADDNCQVINIPGRKMRSLTHISQVVVTILACANSSIPCLGSISLWACPSSYDAQTFQMVRRLLQPSSTRPSSLATLGPFYGSSTGQEVTARSLYQRNCVNNVDDQPVLAMAIPPEMIDPLTGEIMCRPVTLPCGTNVDAMSLEEYIKEEKKWGREPNDPFTRVSFTSQSYPRHNDQLRQQIELFVEQKQHNSSQVNVSADASSTTDSTRPCKRSRAS